MIAMLGVHPNDVLKEINESNLSKFCYNRADADASVDAYAGSDVYEDVHWEVVDDAYVIKGHKIGVDSSNYKILKGIHFRKPDLTKLVARR